MTRRILTAILWLFAVWTVWGALSIYLGLPSLVGPGLGLAVALMIWWDPRGWLWKPAVSPAVRRRIADLQRVPVSPIGEPPEQTTPARS